jgi:hypothetical protein
MALETGILNLSGLNALWPTSTDPASLGDDHIRLIKDAVKKTFTGITGVVTATHTDLNKTSGMEAGATADQTGPEIKALYEVQPNAFTNAQFTTLATLNTKVAGIETGATADQTGAEIKSLYQAQGSAFTDAQFTKLAGIEAGATGDQTAAEILAAVLALDGPGSGLNADLLDGFNVSSTAGAASTIPLRDAQGYLNLGWINTISGATTTAATDYFVNTANDGFIRKKTLALVRAEVVAGNGMSAGNLGTPGAITAVSTDAVTATSHTHSLSAANVGVRMGQLSVGSVGTFAFLKKVSATTGSLAPGAAVAGSDLDYSGFNTFQTSNPWSGTISPAGTWEIQGAGTIGTGGAVNGAYQGVWLRVI